VHLPLRCRSLACTVVAAVGAATPQEPGELRREDALAVSELQPRIDQAIDRGVARLLDLQQRDGSWFGNSDHFPGGQTALSVYTLLKAGLPASHPGVRRGLAHLTTVQPSKVYVAGAMLLALAESGDPDRKPQMERVVANLLEWQQGSWPYPRAVDETGLHDGQDLSITQFALLGLRAARHAGVKVPPACWLEALRTVLRYQDRPRVMGAGKDKTEVAGFHYHLNPGGDSTGSMTTAGLTSLWVAREALGRLPHELDRDVEAAMRLGRNWLAYHFDVRDNPGFAGQRWLYYLYGLERVSALYGVAYWDDRPWYLEGARVLVDKQAAAGDWPHPDAESDTCFAILFLKRATAAKTGTRSAGPRTFTGDAPAADVGVRAFGDDIGGPFTFLLTRVGAADGTRAYAVDRVEYLVDDASVATVAGDGKAWTPARDYASRWQPKARGTVKLQARVLGHRLDADGAKVGEALALESPLLVVEVKEALEDWMLPAATWRARNQLTAGEVEAAASSVLEDGRRADRAVDGREGSAWVCAADDPAPRLVLTFAKSVTARFVVLTQANGARGFRTHFDLVRGVQLLINGSKTPLVAVMDQDELVPLRVDLGKSTRIRRLDIAITSHGGGKTHQGAAGFAEVALEK